LLHLVGCFIWIYLQVRQKWRGAHMLQWYVVLPSKSDDGLLGSYTVLDQFVPPKHRSKPAWIKDPLDHLINTFRENLKHTSSNHAGVVQYMALAGRRAYRVWWSVKEWVFICLNFSVTKSTLLTKAARRTTKNRTLHYINLFFYVCTLSLYIYKKFCLIEAVCMCKKLSYVVSCMLRSSTTTIWCPHDIQLTLL
jgi:hypothetical protein